MIAKVEGEKGSRISKSEGLKTELINTSEGEMQRRINEAFSEGQLDQCDLTLRDLNGIAQAMARVLEAVYHGRPEYPARPAAERAAGPQLVARS